MPPKKPATVEGGSKGPMLKLSVEKGPFSGQTNQFSHGSRIQIGRVVRGNTLSIKDAGISTKHLLIQVDSESEHWTITDLGSSNGTILNGEQLEPSEPVVLSSGDEIKIGELTSMRVTFEVERPAGESNGGNVRRNTRRGVRNQGGQLGVIREDAELGLGGENGDNLGVEGGVGKNVRARRTRSSINSTKEGYLAVSDAELVGNEKKSASGVESKAGNSESVRRTRGLKKGENLGKIEDVELGEQRKSTRRTRSSRKKESFVDLSVIEGISKRKGARENVNVSIETTLEGEKKEGLNLEHERHEKNTHSVAVNNDSVENVEEDATGKSSTSGVERGATGTVEGQSLEIHEEKTQSVAVNNDGLETGNEDATGRTSASRVKQGATGTAKGQSLTDLETMTLGEWFDFLEVFLPQQIIDATEKVISDMKQNAKRLHEYKLQQMVAKGKDKSAAD